MRPLAAALFLLLTAATARAYDCPEPRHASFTSADGHYHLEVTTKGHALFAQDGLVLWQRDFGYQPEKVLFLGDGPTMVLLTGNSKHALVLMTPDGTAVVDYDVEQLFSDRELDAIGWKCGSFWPFDSTIKHDDAKHRLTIRIQKKTLRLDLDTGKIRPLRH